MTVGVPALPRRKLFYKGKELEELDGTAVINASPEIVIVDELAHTNIEGSENRKRWQDVLQILDAGISLISAVNIQHIEGVNEEVSDISKIEIKKRVPGSVVASAQHRPHRRRAHRASQSRQDIRPGQDSDSPAEFFREENILQLRGLALKEVALRVEKKVESEVSTTAWA